MPSQEKSNVEPCDVARAMFIRPDRESTQRIERARATVFEVGNRLYGCIADLRAAQESLRPNPEASQDSIQLEDATEAERFRPGRKFWVGNYFFHSDPEGGLVENIQCLLPEDNESRLMDAIELLETTLEATREWNRHESLTKALEDLNQDQIRALADAGRRNGWLAQD